jgi:ephrin-B
VEKYIIYNVSRDEFENCQITNPNPRVIAICDKPHELIYFTITFRSFTPTPGGLEFRPGKDYFFISTSSRSDLYRRIGGRCSSHNMRVVFKVAETPMETTTTTNGVKNDAVAVNVPRRVAPSVDRKSDLLNVDNEKIGADFPSYLYPMRDVIELDSNSVEHEKRSEDYDRHTNEVIKQASIMTSSVYRLVSSMQSVIVAFSISILFART